jgi:hypothetical protein
MTLRVWPQTYGLQGCFIPKRADEGARTLDLLHGKDTALADLERLKPTQSVFKPFSEAQVAPRRPQPTPKAD